METVTHTARNHEEHRSQLFTWTIDIVSYQIANKFVCIVNNTDPGATICRVCGDSRSEALAAGLKAASSLIAASIFTEKEPTIATKTKVSRIEFNDGVTQLTYTCEDFLNTPLQNRMDQILSGNLTYFGDDDSLVHPGIAITQLSKAGSSNGKAA